MNIFKLTAIICISLCLFSCSDDDDDMMEEDTTCQPQNALLSGTLFNESYTLMQATASFIEDDNEYQIFFFGQDELSADDPCDIIGTQGRQITTFVNNQVEEGAHQSTVYNAATMDLQTAQICYFVESITSTMITGKLSMNDPDNGHVVSGTWEAVICD